MGSRLIIRRTCRQDCFDLADNLRPMEVKELAVTSRQTPLCVLLASVLESRESWTARVPGKGVLAMWGVIPQGKPGVGAVWLLTSNLVEKFPKLFVRTARAEIAKLQERWSFLGNAIWCGHEQAIRWAAREGFTMFEPCPAGVHGEPFMPFRIGGDTWAQQ